MAYARVKPTHDDTIQNDHALMSRQAAVFRRAAVPASGLPARHLTRPTLCHAIWIGLENRRILASGQASLVLAAAAHRRRISGPKAEQKKRNARANGKNNDGLHGCRVLLS
jgi:hypothetical protein